MGPTWLRKIVLFCLNLHVQKNKTLRGQQKLCKKNLSYFESPKSCSLKILIIDGACFVSPFGLKCYGTGFFSLFYYGNLRIMFAHPLNSCKLIETRIQEVHRLWESVATDNFFKNYAYCGDQLFLVGMIAKAEVLAISHQLVHTATSRLHSSVK